MTHLLASTLAFNLDGIDRMSFWHVSWREKQFCSEVLLLSLRLSTAHNLSMGLRSGLFPGHGRTSAPLSSKNFMHLFALWQGDYPAWILKLLTPSHWVEAASGAQGREDIGLGSYTLHRHVDSLHLCSSLYPKPWSSVGVSNFDADRAGRKLHSKTLLGHWEAHSNEDSSLNTTCRKSQNL